MLESGQGAVTTAEVQSYEKVLEQVLDTAREDDFEGYSKHDALNAPLARAARRRARGCAGS